MICPANLAAADGFRTWLAERLSGHAVQVEVEPRPANPAALIRRVAEPDCRLLVIAAGVAEAQPERLRDLVARISCDVLVVR